MEKMCIICPILGKIPSSNTLVHDKEPFKLGDIVCKSDECIKELKELQLKRMILHITDPVRIVLTNMKKYEK